MKFVLSDQEVSEILGRSVAGKHFPDKHVEVKTSLFVDAPNKEWHIELDVTESENDKPFGN